MIESSSNVVAIAQSTDKLQRSKDLVAIENVALAQSTSSNNDYSIKILLIAGLASAAAIIGWRLSASQSISVDNVSKKTSSKALIDRVSPRLRRKLLRLINDPKTANRLLTGIERNHPHRSPDWLAEKVIYDLQRGR